MSSWKSGSLDPPRRSLPKRVSILRKTGNNPSLNGSILDDNSVVSSDKRELQWWKRLNADHNNSTTDFFPVSTQLVNSVESEENIQEESMGFHVDEETFSSLSSLDVTARKPLFKKRENIEKNNKKQNPPTRLVVNESNSSIDNPEIVSVKKLFKHKVSEVIPASYARAVVTSEPRDPPGNFDESKEEEIQIEHRQGLFRMSTKTSQGISVFADGLTNNSESEMSEVIERHLQKTIAEAAIQEFKKDLFQKVTNKNVERKSVFAEALMDDSELSEIPNSSQYFIKSLLSGAEQKQHLFKLTHAKNPRKKSVFADALSDDSESNASENLLMEKSQEAKRTLFKKAMTENVDGKSIFAQALTMNSELDTALDLPEPDMKKQKFSEDAVSVSDSIHIVDPLPDLLTEGEEKMNLLKNHRKSSIIKLGRQSETDALSVISGNSSITSESMNYHKWNQLASSTMVENPKTPRRSERRKSQSVLPAKSLMHSDIAEEKETSTVSSINTKKDSKAKEQNGNCQEIIQLSDNADTPSAQMKDRSYEIRQNISNRSITEKEIEEKNNKTPQSTRKSKRTSTNTENNVSNKSSVEQYWSQMNDRAEEDHPEAVRDAKFSNVHHHSIDTGVLCAGSPDTENIPQTNPLEISKRQSVGTWLKLQDSDRDIVPILNQSYIDKLVTEEVLAKRTNPPVRRSTFGNVNVDNPVENKILAQSDGNISSPKLNNSQKNITKKDKVRHSNIVNNKERSQNDISVAAFEDVTNAKADIIDAGVDSSLLNNSHKDILRKYKVRHSNIVNNKEQSQNDISANLQNVNDDDANGKPTEDEVELSTSVLNNSSKNNTKRYPTRHSNVINNIERSENDTVSAGEKLMEGTVMANMSVEKNPEPDNNFHHSSSEEHHHTSSSIIVGNIEVIDKTIVESKTSTSQNDEIPVLSESLGKNNYDAILSQNSTRQLNDFINMEIDEADSDEGSQLQEETVQKSISINKNTTHDSTRNDNSSPENIFTPRNGGGLPNNSQASENSTMRNLHKSSVEATVSDGSVIISKTKEKKMLSSASRAGTSSSSDKFQEDSTSDDDQSEELFNNREVSVQSSTNQPSHSEKLDPHKNISNILSEMSMKMNDTDDIPRADKRHTRSLASSIKTTNDKENTQCIKIPQAELKKYLEKLQDENIERKKKVEDFSKKILTKNKVLNLKPFGEIAIVRKRRKNSVKKTAKADTLCNGDLKVSSKKKNNKVKLFMKEQWVTSYLCSFIEKKLNPSYGFKTKRRCEKFIKDLVQIVKLVVNSKSDYHRYVVTLKNEMARLKIVTTHLEFYRFIQQYLPHDFRIKSIPACGNSVPKLKEGLFTNITIDVKK